jgi:hypothetical protein
MAALLVLAYHWAAKGNVERVDEADEVNEARPFRYGLVSFRRTYD